jgi:hypothetical protein
MIFGMEEPLRTEVKVAFADSLRVFFQVLIGITALGLLASTFMKGLPLHTRTDRQWAPKSATGDLEMAPDKGIQVDAK